MQSEDKQRYLQNVVQEKQRLHDELGKLRERVKLATTMVELTDVQLTAIFDLCTTSYVAQQGTPEFLRAEEAFRLGKWVGEEYLLVKMLIRFSILYGYARAVDDLLLERVAL